MIKKRNGSLENIRDKITLLNPMNTFFFFPLPPGVVISAYTFDATTPEEGQEKGKGCIELLCTLVPAGIRYPYVVYNVER